MEAFTVCLTGPSGPWKSALAREIEGALLERGMDVQVMEREPGPEKPGSPAAGKEERDRAAGRECSDRCREGIAVLVSTPILEAPFVEEISAGCIRLLEVRCEGSEERSGRPAEPDARSPERGAHPAPRGSQGPLDKPLILVRAGEADVRQCAGKILEMLDALGYCAGSAASAATEYTPEEEKRIAERLADLGYLD
jgi:hypothetical protein